MPRIGAGCLMLRALARDLEVQAAAAFLETGDLQPALRPSR